MPAAFYRCPSFCRQIIWNNQDAIPRADVTEKVVTLGGEGSYCLNRKPCRRLGSENPAVMGVLVAGVVILGLFAVRLLKEMKTEQK